MGQRGFQQRRFAPEVLVAAAARQDVFLTVIMPKVVAHARRRLRNAKAYWREDGVQDAIGNAWKMFVSLIGRGKDPLTQIGSIVKFSVCMVFQYRSVLGQQNRTDAFSRNAQERGNFTTRTNVKRTARCFERVAS